MFNIIYTIVISNSNNYNNNIVYANSLTNNRVLYIDESGKLNTTNVEPNSLNDIINNFKAQLLDIIYPVGSIYISVNNVSPESFLGGTWEQIGAGYALWTTTSGAGETIEAGLPNITGSLFGYFGTRLDSSSGALYAGNTTGRTAGEGGGGKSIGFDASRSNSIYGKSSTVQPPAYKVYAWKRTN